MVLIGVINIEMSGGVYSPEEEGSAGSLWRCHGRARWLTGVGAVVRYGLRPPAILSSNQSGGRGVITKGYSGRRRSPEGGTRRQGFISCPWQWREGAPGGRIDWVFVKRVQQSVDKLVGQSPWPKTPTSGGAISESSG
jgi:hypothetical protein